jgi:hypothetical protein
LPTVFDFQNLQLYSLTADLSPDDPEKSESGNASPDSDKKREILIIRLESILARFVSDYRGIFAIEVECAGTIK